MAIKNYRRSISFPIPSSKSTNNNTAVPRINGKGSTSLPCRFRPFVSQLDDEIRSLKTWRSSHSHSHSDSDPSWICEGLARLDRLHTSLLEDLLQHPQAREVLARRSACADSLHEDFLRLADAHASFRSAIVVLKQEQSATRAAIRRNHASRIASCLREQKKAEKELTKIAAAAKSINTNAGKPSPGPLSDMAELEGIVREAVAVTSEVSAAAFRGIAALSSSSSSSSPMWAHCAVVPMLRKLSSFNKKEEEDQEEENWTHASEKLEALEKCLAEVEAVNENLLRRIINTRVFLLNVLTYSL